MKNIVALLVEFLKFDFGVVAPTLAAGAGSATTGRLRIGTLAVSVA